MAFVSGSVNVSQKIDTEYSVLPCPTAQQFKTLAVEKVYLFDFFFSSRPSLKFSGENHPQLLLSIAEWLWKLAFVADFIMFSREFNLKLRDEAGAPGESTW